MSILKSTGIKGSRSPFEDQRFFQTFEWNNFNKGDIVYLERYEASDAWETIAGVFVGVDNGNVIIRLVSVDDGHRLAEYDCYSLPDASDSIVKNSTGGWERWTKYRKG